MRPDLPKLPPILAEKNFAAPSVFEPENLLREARRQKNLPNATVPDICILDPDGDIVRALVKTGRTCRSAGWPCYHTDLYEFEHGGECFGIIGCAVGAAYAVLLAEQLFVSGCQFLVSMTSAGQIVEQGPPPYFMLIDRALRDHDAARQRRQGRGVLRAQLRASGRARRAERGARGGQHRGRAVGHRQHSGAVEHAKAISGEADVAADATEERRWLFFDRRLSSSSYPSGRRILG